MGRITAYDQNGRMVADFDKSDYDFLLRYGRMPEEVLEENAKLRKENDTLCHRIDELCAENERLRQENQSIGMAAYDLGYRSGSVHYELEHCPACKNIADLQEALEENAKLRELVRDMWPHVRHRSRMCAECELPCAESDECLLYEPMRNRMGELGIEVGK